MIRPHGSHGPWTRRAAVVLTGLFALVVSAVPALHDHEDCFPALNPGGRLGQASLVSSDGHEGHASSCEACVFLANAKAAALSLPAAAPAEIPSADRAPCAPDVGPLFLILFPSESRAPPHA